MTLLDPIARTQAKNLIARFGKPISLVEVTEGSKDLEAGKVTPGEKVHSIRGLFTRVEQKLVDGTKVQWSDQGILLAALALEEVGMTEEPTTDDRVEDGNKQFSIVMVNTVMSGELPALYKLVVRK